MSYEIVKSITIRDGKVFSRMSSNNVFPKDFTLEENSGLTRKYKEEGVTGLYVFLTEGGLKGYLHFQKSGNKLVRQLKYIVHSLFEDEVYRNIKKEVDYLEYKLWGDKEESNKKEQYQNECKIYRKKLHDYIDLKVREFFYPKLVIPSSIKKELDNVLEMYQENLENDEDDVFSGTEDSYAEEMLNQDIYSVLSKENVEKIMELNNNMYEVLNIDFRNKSYNQILEQITDKLYEKFFHNINNLDGIIEVKESEEETIETINL